MINGNYKLILDLITKKLNEFNLENTIFSSESEYKKAAAILFLLGPGNKNEKNEPHLILNKRSRTVSQPGDLCCPGGKVSPKLDFLIAKILKLPGTPLTRYSHWQQLKQNNDNKFIFLATALRESFEEMKLNPLGIKLIGTLPTQHLSITNNAIHPFVCWVTRQMEYHLNSEVDKIIRIPLSELFLKKNYSTYRIKKSSNAPTIKNCVNMKGFPCFVYYQNGVKEILWGVTYRVTTTFLRIVFNYSHNNVNSLF